MLRNREFRRFAILYGLMAAAVAALSFLIHPAAGFLSVFSSAVLGAAFYMFTKARYNSIARLSNQIDLVLHSADRMELDELAEGELSILHSEITKMMMRIREQNDALIKEKIHLADSLADIAHQLRTPLTSANLTLSLMENSSDEEERKIFVRETEELLTRMDWLITSLLKISRLNAGVIEFQSEQVDVSALINSALRPFLIFMELHEIEVETEVQRGMAIRGDSGWLSEAVQNLLKNCMESVGDNGKVKISGTENPLYAEITIHDSGAGFNREELPRLFDRFYCGKSTKKAGYGIGLALSRMIIIRQGGTISAKNHPEGGAVFIIRFPKE